MDASVALRGLQTALLAFAFGLIFLQQFANADVKRRSSQLLALVLLLQVLRIADLFWSLQSFVASDASALSFFQTYGAKVLLAQAACLMAAGALAWLCKPGLKQGLGVLSMLLLSMLTMSLSGHAVSASEEWVLSVAAILHVLLAQLWVAGVLGLLWAKRTASTWTQTLAAFSKWALPGMLLLLVSGVYLSRWSVGSWPGLWATNYGGLLLLKLLFVAGALWCAWQLRQWLLSTEQDIVQAKAWLSSEAGLALAVVCMASVLASTVPASHDTIVWPFSFRWAPVLAWRQDAAVITQALLWSSMCWALGLVLWAWWRKQHARKAWWVLGGSVCLGCVWLVPATTIPAYPTTYMHSSARLDAASVYAGQQLYAQHCMDCHGLHGQGDGPLAKLQQLPAANLTEPHVSWHTHGDMFWWLTHGKGKMPGFGQVLTEDERWHLINFLIAMSLGYEARTLSNTPAPFNPWLPSIDFRFQMDNNNFMSLSEWRGLHAVHLVFVNQQTELQRVRDLLQDMKGFPAQLVIVTRPEWIKDLVKGPCEAILVGDAQGDIIKAWAHYRRTFASPDFQNEETLVPRMEFLIDRYGFVRARWRSDETPNALTVNELKVVYDSLAPEGEIKSAAIHQHD